MCETCEDAKPAYVGSLVKCQTCGLDIAISLQGHECPFLGVPAPSGFLDGTRYRHPPCGMIVSANEVETHRCVERSASDVIKKNVDES